MLFHGRVTSFFYARHKKSYFAIYFFPACSFFNTVEVNEGC